MAAEGMRAVSRRMSESIIDFINSRYSLQKRVSQRTSRAWEMVWESVIWVTLLPRQIHWCLLAERLIYNIFVYLIPHLACSEKSEIYSFSL